MLFVTQPDIVGVELLLVIFVQKIAHLARGSHLMLVGRRLGALRHQRRMAGKPQVPSINACELLRELASCAPTFRIVDLVLVTDIAKSTKTVPNMILLNHAPTKLVQLFIQRLNADLLSDEKLATLQLAFDEVAF